MNTRDSDPTNASTQISVEKFKFGEKEVYVEVIEPKLKDEPAVTRFSTAESMTRDIGEAIDNALPVADALIQKLKSLTKEPDDIEVTFGVKLSGKVGALIASTSVDGNFQVKLKWSGS